MGAPNTYGGLELWLKGDTGLYTDNAATIAASADGDAVAVWQDQSGNNRHLTQTTGANRPTLDVATGLNGKSCVKYQAGSGAGQWHVVPNFLTGFTAAEIYAVLRSNTDPSIGPSPYYDGAIWQFGSYATFDNWYPFTDGVVYDAFGSTTRQTCGNPTQNLASYHTVNILSKAADWRMWINENLQFSTTSNTVGFTTAPKIGRSVTGLYWWSGRIAELFIFSQERSSAERAELMAYLDSRYALYPTPNNIVTTQAIAVVRDSAPNAVVTSEPLLVVRSANPDAVFTQVPLVVVRQRLSSTPRSSAPALIGA